MQNEFKAEVELPVIFLHVLVSPSIYMTSANAFSAVHLTIAMGRVQFTYYLQGAFKVNTMQFPVFN